MFNSPKPTPQSQAVQPQRAWRKHLQSACLLLALTTSPLGVTATAVAQSVAGKTAAVAARLGLKAVDLTPQGGAQIYRDNPNAEETNNSALNVDRSTSGVSDMVGTLSVQNFQGTQGALYNTHASADGFRNYFNTWYQPNFARRDGDVSVWLYHDIAGGDNYDLWNSGGTDYGIDAVRVAFHSGHGGMAATNVFFAPLGANWGGRGWNAFSNRMYLGGNHSGYGDERLRYMFWDTCNSVMVSGGHTPYLTWGVRSKGVRFVFGYETVSIDSPNYGKFFWEEWNKNKTLAQAFLDASWRINTGQSPAVVAFGSNQTDATNRLNTERYLYAGSVGNNWGQWRWYYARSAARAALASLTHENKWFSQEQQFTVRQAAARGNSPAEITEIARAFGIAVKGEQQIQERPFGLRAIETKGATLLLEANGNFELVLNVEEAKDAGNEVLSDEELISRAEKMAQELNLLKGQATTVGMIRDLNEGGGGDVTTAHARVIEKTVIFDQMIDGIPFIDPEAGHLEITFDARSGQTKRVRSTLQIVEAANVAGAQATKRLSVTEARAEAMAKAEFQANAKQLEITAGTEAIGLQLIDGKIVPVLRAEIRNPQDPFARPQLAVVPLVK